MIPEIRKIARALNAASSVRRYFSLLHSDKKKKRSATVNDQINSLLQTYPKLQMEWRIDWEQKQEISEEVFRSFACSKLSTSMAYDSKIMSKDKASEFVDEFISFFEPGKRFFTNWSDVEFDSPNSNGWTPITENTFDCVLIVVGSNGLGAIVMIDED